MEIERKFLLKQLPNNNDTLIGAFIIQQSYLVSVGNTEVRIRAKMNSKTQEVGYRLCFKSSGGLVREEVEIDITEEKYLELLELVNKNPISKIYFMHMIRVGEIKHLVEISVVDMGLESGFIYAEVEFNSEEEANNFNPSNVFTDFTEVTTDAYWKMKSYWNRTRGDGL